MKILSSEDRLDNQYITPLIDTSKDLIINTVPYDKVTKTPMPFRNVAFKNCNNILYGKNSFHPFQEKMFYKTNDYAHFGYETACMNYYANYNSHETLVDSGNNNISYVITINNYPTTSNKSSTYGNYYTSIKKITKTNDNILVETKNITDIYNYVNSLCTYFTQKGDYIYAMIETHYSSNGSYYNGNIHSFMYKINKQTLEYSRCYCSSSGSRGTDYVTGNTDHYYYNASFCKVLKETNDGLILYSTNIYESSVNSSYSPGSLYDNYNDQYITIDFRFYSFETNRMTRITYTLDENCPTPPFCDYVFNKNSYLCSSSNYMNKMCIPSKCLETETKYYFYVLSHTCSSSSDIATTSKPDTLYLFEQDKSDVLTSTIYKVNLVFPEGSDISEIPYYNSSSFSNVGVQAHNSYRHETQVFNINGVDYVNIWYEGVNNYPKNERGVYTFKVNQDKTEATYLGSYRAVGGALHGYMPLNNDETKILISTPTSYHIAIFDSEAEEWKITYESMKTLQSIIQTDDDKIYALTDSNELICQDLEGATTIDFTFEQTSYQYNDTDITTYIQLWSKNSEDEYVETTVKLTLQGNAVWQSNGLQTLTITTSDEGKINVPFVIKGQSTINVSVDVVL